METKINLDFIKDQRKYLFVLSMRLIETDTKNMQNKSLGSENPDLAIKEEAEKQRHNERMKAAVLTKTDTSKTSDIFFQQKQNMKELRKLEAEVDKIKTLPRNGTEYKREQKKIRAQEEAHQKKVEEEKAFRLTQPPKYQSPFAKQQEENFKKLEQEKLKQLQEEYWTHSGTIGMSPLKAILDQQVAGERDNLQKKVAARKSPRVPSDKATVPVDDPSNLNVNLDQFLIDDKQHSQQYKSPQATNNRSFQKYGTMQTGLVGDSFMPERVNPSVFKTFVSNRESYDNGDPNSGPVSNSNINLFDGDANGLPKIPSPQRNIAKNNSYVEMTPPSGGRNHNANTQRGEKDLDPKDVFARQMSQDEFQQKEMMKIVSQGGKTPISTNTKYVPESDVRNQLEEMVKQQIMEQQQMGQTAGPRFRSNTQKTDDDIRDLRVAMNLTGLNQPSGTNTLADDPYITHRTNRNDDARSQKTHKTNRSALTTKNRYIQQAKVVAGGSLAPVGMTLNAKEKEPLKANKQRDMLTKVLGTEILIEKIMKMLHLEEDEEWLKEWPVDCNPNEDLQQDLSHTKMQNEINHREPRGFSLAGTIEPHPLFSSKTGCHCGSRKWRQSELEQLGPGISLYFKMLKYFGLIFSLFFLLSLPSILVYSAGTAYQDEPVLIQKLLAFTSLGNLDSGTTIVSSFVNVTPVKNFASMLFIQCPPYSKIKDLNHFGLAFKEHRPVGFGVNTTVSTIDRCTAGTMLDKRNEAAIEDAFENSCIGKTSCHLPLQFAEIFDQGCQKELKKRLAGDVRYGPARIYALTACQEDGIRISADTILSRDDASKLVVSIDVAIMILFVLAVYRLKYYESLSVQDMKNGSFKVEDFSVYIEKIPVSPEDYNNNPELLTAMMAVHLEDVIRNELHVVEEMDDTTANHGEVSSVHFGLTSQNIIRHLVNIFEEVKTIAVLEKKMKHDPLNAAKYEREKWQLYNKVTHHKNKYYAEKMTVNPQIKNAYVTFRSMEGKQRAMQAYETGTAARLFAEYICCMKSVFQKKKLLKKGYYSIRDTVEPETIIWENLGVPASSKFFRWVGALSLAAVLFAISFAGIQQIATIERKRVDYIKSECDPRVEYTEAEAYLDLSKHKKIQQGFLNCYCQSMLDKYGTAGLKVVFEDDAQHCQDWYPYENLNQYTTWMLAAFVAITNLGLHIVINWLGQFKRDANTTEGFKFRMKMIFAAQYVNTAILFLVAYNSFLQSTSTRLDNRPEEIFVGPFDEFNQRWYLVIGSPILLTILFQILSPHLGAFMTYMWTLIRRCHDRSWTLNMRKTKQVIQEDYEDLYTGPEFLVQIRFAQLLSTIFVTMTYSSGLPILYLIGGISIFFTYWVDKVLVLRYFRLTPTYTHYLSRSAVKLMPWAVVVHMCFGLIMFSYPYILRTEINESYFGNGTQYFNRKRLGQHHMIIFFAGSILVLFIIAFEKTLTHFASIISKAMTACCSRESDPQYDDQFEWSDDLYSEINFLQLYNEYKKIRKERQKFKLLRSKGSFTEAENKKYVDKYIEIIERNEGAIFQRLIDLTEDHIDRIEGIEADMMSNEAKIKTVLEYYSQSMDKNNPLRSTLVVDDSMRGRMSSQIQSYDLMDNLKYKQIDELLLVMKETFGYNEDLQGLIKNSITGAELILAKKSIELRKMMKDPVARFGAFGVEIDDSIRSAEPLHQGLDDRSGEFYGRSGITPMGQQLNKTMDH